MMRNKVAVVIPYYNSGRFLYETVQSVKSQTCKASEIIVIDDGSDDPESLDTLDSLKSDEEIKIIRKENGGVSSARNFGISEANSDFIVPLDADDLLHPTFIQACLEKFLADPSLSIVATEAKYIGAKSHSMKFPKISRKNLRVMNCLVVTAMFRKGVWASVGGYRENMVHGYEDWDFWLSCVDRDMVFYRIPRELFNYRIKAKSRNTELLSYRKRKREMKQLLRTNHADLFEKEEVSFLREVYLKTRYIYLDQLIGEIFS